MTNAPDYRLVVRDYRVLRSVDWSPQPGVSLLTGPNGSGKTTVLSALKFLRGLFTFGHERALGFIRGVHLRRRRAPAEAPVHFEFHLGDVHWTLDFPVDARGLVSNYGFGDACGDAALEDAARDMADADQGGCDGRSGASRDMPGRGESSDIGWWADEPDVGRVAHGVASRVDRLACLGNGQVPAVAALAWRRLSQDA